MRDEKSPRLRHQAIIKSRCSRSWSSQDTISVVISRLYRELSALWKILGSQGLCSRSPMNTLSYVSKFLLALPQLGPPSAKWRYNYRTSSVTLARLNMIHFFSCGMLSLHHFLISSQHFANLPQSLMLIHVRLIRKILSLAYCDCPLEVEFNDDQLIVVCVTECKTRPGAKVGVSFTLGTPEGVKMCCRGPMKLEEIWGEKIRT